MSNFKHTPEEARRFWVEALESGEYQQGKHMLCVDDTYCPLGLACEVYQKYEGGLSVLKLSTGLTTYNGYSITLPDLVQLWLGMSDSMGSYYDPMSNLMDDNDFGKSFQEIAQIIRSKPEGLFKE